tara:strand:- start:708 stop:1022 length:315 start_codon:yes stop_codon:yes gene_type:complete
MNYGSELPLNRKDGLITKDSDHHSKTKKEKKLSLSEGRKQWKLLSRGKTPTRTIRESLFKIKGLFDVLQKMTNNGTVKCYSTYKMATIMGITNVPRFSTDMSNS